MQSEGSFDIEELKTAFDGITDHNFRKIIKALNGQEDSYQKGIFYVPNAEQICSQYM